MRAPGQISPLGLVQELVLPLGPENERGWRILVVAVCLNRAKGRIAAPIVLRFLERWPTPLAAADADEAELASELRPLGIQTTRAKTIRKLSRTWLDGEWVSPSDLPGVGEYALACWRIFVEGDLPDREPRDGWLAAYWRWARSLSPPIPVTTRSNGNVRPTPFADLPPADPGDCVYVARDVAKFAQISVELVRREWNAGKLGGRKTNTRGGFVTTRSAVLRWAHGLRPLADLERERERV